MTHFLELVRLFLPHNRELGILVVLSVQKNAQNSAAVSKKCVDESFSMIESGKKPVIHSAIPLKYFKYFVVVSIVQIVFSENKIVLILFHCLN